jgi:hypothetical protein
LRFCSMRLRTSRSNCNSTQLSFLYREKIRYHMPFKAFNFYTLPLAWLYSDRCSNFRSIWLFGGCLIGVGICIRSGSVADGKSLLCYNHENWFKCFGSHFGINSFVFLSAAWFLVLVPRYTLLSLIFCR